MSEANANRDPFRTRHARRASSARGALSSWSRGPCLLAGALLLAGPAACSRHGRDGDANAADAAPVAAASASVAPDRPAPAGAATFFGPKLAQEAQGRPTGTPKAEEVLAAIAAAGIPLEGQAQHVASTVGAHFCLGATAPLGLRMSACEYDTEAGALAGRDLSAKAFGKIEHRDITVNKKTTLTILQAPFTPGSQAAHDKALAAFTTM